MKATNSYFWYSIGSPKVKVCHKNCFKITTFLDTDIEINTIIRKLIKDVNLAIKGPKLELILYIGYNCFYKDIKVAIKEFKTRNLILIIEASNYDLVLSQSFLNFVKFI